MAKQCVMDLGQLSDQEHELWCSIVHLDVFNNTITKIGLDVFNNNDTITKIGQSQVKADLHQNIIVQLGRVRNM